MTTMMMTKPLSVPAAIKALQRASLDQAQVEAAHERLIQEPHVIGKSGEARAYDAKVAASNAKREDADDRRLRANDDVAYAKAAASRRFTERNRDRLETMIRQLNQMVEECNDPEVADGENASRFTLAMNGLRSIAGEPDAQAP